MQAVIQWLKNQNISEAEVGLNNKSELQKKQWMYCFAKLQFKVSHKDVNWTEKG
jgi:hypothetical protein